MPAKESRSARPQLSVVVPVYNESENVAGTVAAIEQALAPTGRTFEIVLVNDGSTDDTAERIADLAAGDGAVRPAGYAVNAGRGRALRTGFQAARGEFVATIDADLSYHPSSILNLLAALEADAAADFAIGSPYAPGGRIEGVPALRLMVSRLGNSVLRVFMPGGFHTFTGIFRCYRRAVLDDLVLGSDGKEIHLEILTKALALGLKGVEVSAVLRGRKRGRSKFRFRRTAVSHIVYGLHERPMVIFGLAGLGMLLVAVALAVWLLVLSASGVPVGNRPLLLFAVFLGLSAMGTVAIGFIAIQNVALRNELYKIASQNKRISDRLAGLERSACGPTGEGLPAEGPDGEDK